jgi:hypothetical protein
VRTRKRFIALTNSPSIAPTFLVSSGFGSTIRRDFGSSSIWQFFDSAVLRLSSSSTQMFFDLAVLEMCGWLPPRQKATGNNLARF